MCKLLSAHVLRVQRAKVLYLVQESFLFRPFRICISQPTDLDIITSEREITPAEQLALHAICCTSAPFQGGLWARDSVHSLVSTGDGLVYPSIRVFKFYIFLHTEYQCPQSFCFARYVPVFGKNRSTILTSIVQEENKH